MRDREGARCLVLDCRCDEPHGRASFTAIIEREGNLYAALCPELDVASQGTSIESALDNLKEAVALFLETADPSEMKDRRREHVFVTQFQAAGG
jgi:predicted RNase H-like HicB family nuclease